MDQYLFNKQKIHQGYNKLSFFIIILYCSQYFFVHKYNILTFILEQIIFVKYIDGSQPSGKSLIHLPAKFF